MATLRITVKGNLGQISATYFAVIIQRSIKILHSLDKRLSQKKGGTLQWVIAGLGEGSGHIDLATRIRKGDVDYAPQVKRVFTGGIRCIQEQGITPAHFSGLEVMDLRIIVQAIGQDGITGVNYLDPDSESVELTANTETKISQLLGHKYYAFGSIEGAVELVSLKRRGKRFDITDPRTQRSIQCSLPDELKESVWDAIHDHPRIVATGLIAYNGRNESIRLDVRQPLRFLGEATELPTSQDLAGADRDFTGQMSTEEYVRSIRGG